MIFSFSKNIKCFWIYVLNVLNDVKTANEIANSSSFHTEDWVHFAKQIWIFGGNKGWNIFFVFCFTWMGCWLIIVWKINVIWYFPDIIWFLEKIYFCNNRVYFLRSNKSSKSKSLKPLESWTAFRIQPIFKL